MNANASDPHLLVAAIGLGLVCIRLGDFAAALSAVQGIGLADLEAGNQLDLCFIRAVAHRRVGVRTKPDPMVARWSMSTRMASCELN